MKPTFHNAGFTSFERNFQTGFTLIEVVLSLAIAASIAVAVFGAFQLIHTISVRQEGSGVVVWEGDLIVHQLRSFMASVSEPGPGETSDSLTLTDNSTVFASDGTLVWIKDGTTTALSSSRVRIASLSFQDFGTAEFPGLVRASFTLSTLSSDSRTSYEQSYGTSFYAR